MANPTMPTNVSVMNQKEAINESSFDTFCEVYRRKQDALSLISQLNHLVIAVQKHRGYSLGLLGGDGAFEDEFDLLQGRLERRLATLEAFARKTGGLLTSSDQENLHLAWQTIRHDWQDDDVNDNFELHSHFIEQLLSMTYSVAKQLEQPLASLSGGNVQTEAPELVSGAGYPRLFQQIEVINFTTKQLPQMIEQLGKIRGLSTFVSSVGKVDYISDRKLRYLVQHARELNEKLRQQALRLEEVVDEKIDGLSELKNHEIKLFYLLNLIEGDVLSGRVIKTSSQRLFELATEIIDIYWSTVNSGLNLLQRRHSESMEEWIFAAQ